MLRLDFNRIQGYLLLIEERRVYIFLMIQERKKLCLFGSNKGVFIVEGKENLGFEIFSEVLC